MSKKFFCILLSQFIPITKLLPKKWLKFLKTVQAIYYNIFLLQQNNLN